MRIAVDHSAGDLNRHVEAGATLGIGEPDRLGHGVGKLSTMLKGLKSKAGAIEMGILGTAILGQFLEFMNQSHDGAHFFWHRA